MAFRRRAVFSLLRKIHHVRTIVVDAGDIKKGDSIISWTTGERYDIDYISMKGEPGDSHLYAQTPDGTELFMMPFEKVQKVCP